MVASIRFRGLYSLSRVGDTFLLAVEITYDGSGPQGLSEYTSLAHFIPGLG
jgi:hypothetical protein